MKKMHKVTFTNGHWILVWASNAELAEKEAIANRMVDGEPASEVLRSELLEVGP